MEFTSQFKQNAQKVIESLKENLKSIRTGRATPSLVENLIVETYGGQTKLKLLELSTITTEGPAALSIVPFDPSTTQDIEKTILKSPLGLSPAVQGSRIIIRIPPLSEEQREKFIKIVAGIIEEKKVTIRNHRDETRKVIKTSFEKKETTED
jgi:ribosome recycling factor